MSQGQKFHNFSGQHAPMLHYPESAKLWYITTATMPKGLMLNVYYCCALITEYVEVVW